MLLSNRLQMFWRNSTFQMLCASICCFLKASFHSPVRESPPPHRLLSLQSHHPPLCSQWWPTHPVGFRGCKVHADFFQGQDDWGRETVQSCALFLMSCSPFSWKLYWSWFSFCTSNSPSLCGAAICSRMLMDILEVVGVSHNVRMGFKRKRALKPAWDQATLLENPVQSQQSSGRAGEQWERGCFYSCCYLKTVNSKLET